MGRATGKNNAAEAVIVRRNSGLAGGLLDGVSLEGFQVVERDGYALVSPAKNNPLMMRANEWSPEQEKFRSLMYRIADEQVVSMGFGKFWNYTEKERDTALLNHALENGDPVWFTDKVDGSLAIRSVVDGNVIFRTRGTFDGGDYGRAMRRVAEAKYPVLLDPSFEPDRSLLFEFVSPDFRIVLRYPEDDLVFLGAVDHSTFELADLPELRQMAETYQLKLVDVHELPTDPEALVAAVHAFEGKEGVVARCNNGQTLVKLKGASYLAHHRLRFALTARVVREVCLERDIQSIDDFQRYLEEQGGDWEMVEDARPLVETFIAARTEARQTFEALQTEVGRKLLEYPNRKDFAVEYATKLPREQQGAAFSLADGRADRAYELVEKSMLDQAFAKAEAADDERLAALDADE